MRDVARLMLASFLTGGVGAAALAQGLPPVNAGAAAAASDAADFEDAQAIVVRGQKLPGATLGEIQPETMLSPADIRSYGVSTVSELLSELSAQTSTGQGRDGGAPVVLLNGKRISGMAEIRDIPTEAIRRVDIMPEEVALKYGYRPDQKVVNIVLRPRFRATTTELEGSTTTEGGRETGQANAYMLRIQGDNRLNLGLRYQRAEPLLESDRDVTSRALTQPYDPVGNITAPRGAASSEIDPTLSALAGTPVTVAGVPVVAGNGRPTVASFVPGANRANVTDTAGFRTLQSSTDQLVANVVLARPLWDGVSGTFTGTFTANGSTSDQGLATASLNVPAGSAFSPFTRPVQLYRFLGDDALQQRVRSTDTVVGANLNGSFSGTWRWNFTGSFDHADTRTRTDRGYDLTGLQSAINLGTVNPFGAYSDALLPTRPDDRARAKNDIGKAAFVTSGTIASIKAGAISGSFTVSGEFNELDSTSTRLGVVTRSNSSRKIGSGQASVDVPIASARNDVLPFLGELSVNLNAGIDQVSNFGALKTYGVGTNWRPVKGVSLVASFTSDEGAPTVQQLSNPVIATPEVRVYDFVTGRSVDVIRTSGGNPFLTNDNRHVWKLGVTLKPFTEDLTLQANYVRTRTRNSVASFPLAIGGVEAAFPGRFTRDVDGNLTAIDARPIQYEREDSQQLRWGINFSKGFKTAAGERQQAEMRERFAAMRAAREAQREQAPTPQQQESRNAGDSGQGERAGGGGLGGGPGGPGGPPGGFGGPRGPGGGQGGRIRLSVYHTWYFQDEILIRQGIPKLDLLDGAATGNNGGQPRHLIDAQLNVTRNGLGFRLGAKYQSATKVTGGSVNAVGSTGDLRFGDLATASLRLFADVGGIPGMAVKHPWTRGLRVSLGVDNVFNQRIRVRDATGATPLSYQPEYLDPLGRVVKISIRKLFFPTFPQGPGGPGRGGGD
ncbi:TonB-dependent receptor [Sphingomonas montanisoli]|uniref:TonB-dependent receptor n=1 Tax=Sphingomonas montanisoli TaxID=2606412 RepID=UPI0015E17BD7|nr:TonB-dependent receptor [Sphingomonas montanisoli]